MHAQHAAPHRYDWLSLLPLRRTIPHSLYDFDGAQVCLIAKDKKGELPYLAAATVGSTPDDTRH